ncbi:FimD/PapC C-terminal domain-containing protein [Avibacterium paragallinarum]|uniref:FimD/PapC C-terminal domain-containing protein n=1 Tax=Avibacterium paragallinarum TaxID=728 RepID=UPI0024344392|nr:FimD/PapC C-terminal domain-containing protein [Avibacterium paragallinarum]
MVYFEIQNNESFPPMGTEVFDQENNPVGIVAQGGKIYSRGIPRTGKLNIHWGEKRCIADYQVPKMKDDKPIVVPIQCQFY